MDAQTTAVLVGGIVLAVSVLGKVIERLMDLLLAQMKGRKQRANGGNGQSNGTRSRIGPDLISEIATLSGRIAGNTDTVRELARAGLELKVTLAEGVVALGTKVERSAADVMKCQGEALQRVEDRLSNVARDCRDTMVSALRAGGRE